MKKYVILLIAAAVVLLALSGCTSTSMSMPGTVLPLEDAEYEILGDTQAEATGIVILGIPIAGRKLGWINYPTNPLYIRGIDPVERVKASALYKTLKQMPEADSVIAPRWEIESFKLGIFYQSHKVRVTAKGVRLQEGLVEKVK